MLKTFVIFNVSEIPLINFDEVFETQSVPNNPVKNWHMRQEFLTQKYTTSWDDLPEVFS